jgi:hypothetical protein
MGSPPTKKELEGIENMTSPAAKWSALRSARDVPLGMSLHDEAEREAVWQLLFSSGPRNPESGSIEPSEEVVEMYRSVRFWRHMRFLDTYKGFVKVISAPT